jgi:hypothetical protein
LNRSKFLLYLYVNNIYLYSFSSAHKIWIKGDDWNIPPTDKVQLEKQNLEFHEVDDDEEEGNGTGKKTQHSIPYSARKG